MTKRISVLLGELAAPGRSVISGPFGSNIGKRFFKTSGVPIIRGNNLTTDFKQFVDDGFVFLTEEKANELKSDAIEGDILFTAAGTIGQVGMIPKGATYSRYVISNKQLRFRVDTNKADPSYVFLWLASPWTFKTILNRNTGSTVPLINLSIIKGLPIELPSEVSEQRKIAQFIENIDAKIELNNQINAELEAISKLLYDYWFVQFDFPMTAEQATALGQPELEGKPYKTSGGKMVFNPTLKRDIPEDWEDGTLGSVCSMTRGVTYNKDDVLSSLDPNVTPILRATNVTGSTIDTNNMVYIPEDLVTEKQLILKDDILIVMSSGSKNHIGKNAPYYFEHKIAFGAFCSKITPKPSHKSFVKTCMQSQHFKGHIRNVCLGTNINNLTTSHISDYTIIKPAKKVLVKFEQALHSSYEMIGNNQKQNQELTTLRDWLLPMLMNGQVTVK